MKTGTKEIILKTHTNSSMFMRKARNSQNKGCARTLYFSKENVQKIARWEAKGLSLSKIVQYLIDNAPEEF